MRHFLKIAAEVRALAAHMVAQKFYLDSKFSAMSVDSCSFRLV